jgi:hypothetical protein
MSHFSIFYLPNQITGTQPNLFRHLAQSYPSQAEPSKKSQDKISVADPNLNPDPYVFGLTGSGSGSFFHQAKIVRKTLIPTVL